MRMRVRRMLMSGSCLWLSLTVVPAIADDYYIWQRRWNDRLTDSVAERPSSQCAVLFAELEWRGRHWQWREIALPKRLSVRTAVLRMNIFDPSRADEWLQLLQAQIACFSSDVRTVELDIDVPERLLDAYADWLTRVRPLVDSRCLTVTALPAHLGHTAFRRVADQVDSYVLQLHGIRSPREVCDGRYALMDETVAVTAIEQAKALQRPFKIALPTYAYVLEFSDSGQFKRLYAENFPFDTLSPHMRLVQPDLALLARIIRRYPELPRIWFRHPAPDDRYNLDMEAIRELKRLAPQAESPRRTLNLTLERKENRLCLLACYRNHIPDTAVRISLHWMADSAIQLEGETFLFNGATRSDAMHAFGPMPGEVLIPPRRCGEPFPVAVFLFSGAQPSLPIFTLKDTDLCLELSLPR